ncbi:hypothetical protein ACFYNO_18635 [Kitasatospora sp. NPDC006697]|uniref:hypothetical protein n=1 Tax=Kitasatospora sp. NPDC006697 TaxID=3364020 RepID=UPI003694C801
MPTTPAPTAEAWLRGVAANPAAPAGVLLRLLAAPAAVAVLPILCGQRTLPAEVAEAVLAHPDPVARLAFARNPHVDPAQRGRLAEDPDGMVRASLASGPHPRPQLARPLPDEVLDALLTAEDRPGLLSANEIRHELAFSGQIPHSFRRRMPEHPDARLRRDSTVFWFWLTPAQRSALLADSDPAVREAARREQQPVDPASLPQLSERSRYTVLTHYAVSLTLAERCLAERRDLDALARNRRIPEPVVARLVRDPDPEIRERMADRGDLTVSQLTALIADPDPAVRTRAELHGTAPHTWPQCLAVNRVLGGSAEQIGPVGELYREPETAWYAACADSPHAALRRTAATCPLLPEQLVHRLAIDPDQDVRDLLAYNHPKAPPTLLLDAFLSSPSRRAHLLTLPRLPRTGLHHLLDHPDPQVRTLAAADPTLPSPPIPQLTDTADTVRHAAAANPLLPPALLEELLLHPELAEPAAANPAHSVARLHQLLDASGA